MERVGKIIVEGAIFSSPWMGVDMSEEICAGGAVAFARSIIFTVPPGTRYL
jgi:hypothetical protein